MKTCSIICIKSIDKSFTGDESGSLSFFESGFDVPFEFRRIYYISGVKKGITRGFHAHKHLKQFLFCPYGKIELTLEDENGKELVVLDKPNIGVLIDHPVWREMKWLVDNSVLCVVASDYYSEDDYIRDHDSFISFISKNFERGEKKQ